MSCNVYSKNGIILLSITRRLSLLINQAKVLFQIQSLTAFLFLWPLGHWKRVVATDHDQGGPTSFRSLGQTSLGSNLVYKS